MGHINDIVKEARDYNDCKVLLKEACKKSTTTYVKVDNFLDSKPFPNDTLDKVTNSLETILKDHYHTQENEGEQKLIQSVIAILGLERDSIVRRSSGTNDCISNMQDSCRRHANNFVNANPFPKSLSETTIEEITNKLSPNFKACYAEWKSNKDAQKKFDIKEKEYDMVQEIINDLSLNHENSIAKDASSKEKCIEAMNAKIRELAKAYVKNKQPDLKSNLENIIGQIQRTCQRSFVNKYERHADAENTTRMYKRGIARAANLMPQAKIWLCCKKDIGIYKRGKWYWVEKIDNSDCSFYTRRFTKNGEGDWCYLEKFVTDDFQAGAYFDVQGCFSSEVTLSTPDGLKKLHELKAGEYVEAFDGSFTRVLAVVKHLEKLTPMIRLDVGSKSLTMTANHLVFVDGAGYIRTDKVMVGDCINGEKVIAITTKMKHAMCLHTFKHDIMVNSLRATWYTEEEKFIMKFQPLWNILDKTAPYYPQFLIDCLQLVTDVIVRAMDEDFISGWFVGILLLIIGTILAICTGSLILGFVGVIYLLFQHSGSSFGTSYFLQN